MAVWNRSGVGGREDTEASSKSCETLHKGRSDESSEAVNLPAVI